MTQDANEIINQLGGTYATARLCDITPPSVSEWRAKNAIPKARLMFIKLARPDVFGQVKSKRKHKAAP